jgi:hypothetical protein
VVTLPFVALCQPFFAFAYFYPSCYCITDLSCYRRTAVLFHLRAPDEPGNEELFAAAMEKASNSLRRYSRLAEENNAMKLCTYNLHLLNCRSALPVCLAVGAVHSGCHGGRVKMQLSCLKSTSGVCLRVLCTVSLRWSAVVHCPACLLCECGMSASWLT